MAKKSGDISVNTLEQLVKTQGDGVVTGFVRYKKIKTCKGYKEARKKANFRFSKITGGRRINNGEYAAVIGFRWIILLIFIMILAIGFLIWKFNTKAEVRNPIEYPTPIPTYEEIKEITVPPYETMDIPGFSDMTLSKDKHGITISNPENNNCNLKYCFYIGDLNVFESELLEPGDSAEVLLYNSLIKGVYRVTIITTGYSDEGEQLNSVSQTVLLTVEK